MFLSFWYRQFALRIGTALLIASTVLIASFPQTAIAADTVIFLTSGTSWTVPSDWNSSNNTIEVIGGGGGGGRRNGGGGGGGGGAYSKITNVSLTPGASVGYAVGAAGTGATSDSSENGTPGGDTYFCNSTLNCGSISGSAVQVGAKGGSGNSGGSGGAGGASGSGVGTTKYSGGTGGNSGDGAVDVGGGGGGAGGPHGNGGGGGNGVAGTVGGGGGGADAGETGNTDGNGEGGDQRDGTTGGGAPGNPGGNGSSGGGGGGGNAGGASGGTGSNETLWTQTSDSATAGSGAGGGGSYTNGTGGVGGSSTSYGGAGAGGGFFILAGNGGNGRQGIIVITYGPTGLTLSGNVLFQGNLSITGALSKGSGTFVIDHPLKPYTHLLYHSFVESPDVKNLYDGVATLDRNGEVVIHLPAYFDALNTEPRYQFFPHYQPMPNLHVKEEVRNNRFVIAGGAPGGEISWQVTATRHDPYILANPIVNEVPKGPGEPVDRGECLYEVLCL